MSNELAIFTPIQADSIPVVKQAMEIKKIENGSDSLTAGIVLKQIKSFLSALKGVKDAAKRPHIDANKLIDDHYNRLAEPLLKAEDHIKRGQLDYNAAETKRKEIERRALEEAKRKEDEQRALSKARDVTPDDDFDSLLMSDADLNRAALVHKTNIEVQQFVADKTHGSAVKELEKKAVKGVRKVWVFSIENQDLIPRQFMVPNESAIRKAVEFGDIPGVKRWEEERISAR